MAKKLVSAALALVLLFALSACSGGGTKGEKTTATAPKQTEVVDLTTMGDNMVYSELYNIISQPDEFIGKTIKMRGTYAVYEGKGRNYYVCEVRDATACCSQGLEFVLADENYPEYNPDEPFEIELTGTLNTYTEDDQPYVQLENATMTKL